MRGLDTSLKRLFRPGSGPKKKGGFEQPGFFAAAAAGEQLCAQYRLVTEDDYG